MGKLKKSRSKQSAPAKGVAVDKGKGVQTTTAGPSTNKPPSAGPSSSRPTPNTKMDDNHSFREPESSTGNFYNNHPDIGHYDLGPRRTPTPHMNSNARSDIFGELAPIDYIDPQYYNHTADPKPTAKGRNTDSDDWGIAGTWPLRAPRGPGENGLAGWERFLDDDSKTATGKGGEAPATPQQTTSNYPNNDFGSISDWNIGPGEIPQQTTSNNHNDKPSSTTLGNHSDWNIRPGDVPQQTTSNNYNNNPSNTTFGNHSDWNTEPGVIPQQTTSGGGYNKGLPYDPFGGTEDNGQWKNGDIQGRGFNRVHTWNGPGTEDHLAGYSYSPSYRSYARTEINLDDGAMGGAPDKKHNSHESDTTCHEDGQHTWRTAPKMSDGEVDDDWGIGPSENSRWWDHGWGGSALEERSNDGWGEGPNTAQKKTNTPPPAKKRASGATLPDFTFPPGTPSKKADDAHQADGTTPAAEKDKAVEMELERLSKEVEYLKVLRKDVCKLTRRVVEYRADFYDLRDGEDDHAIAVPLWALILGGLVCFLIGMMVSAGRRGDHIYIL